MSIIHYIIILIYYYYYIWHFCPPHFWNDCYSCNIWISNFSYMPCYLYLGIKYFVAPSGFYSVGKGWKWLFWHWRLQTPELGLLLYYCKRYTSYYMPPTLLYDSQESKLDSCQSMDINNEKHQRHVYKCKPVHLLIVIHSSVHNPRERTHKQQSLKDQTMNTHLDRSDMKFVLWPL